MYGHVREQIALLDPQAILGVENTVAIRIDDPSAFLDRRGFRKLSIDREVAFARNRGVVGHAASIFDLLAERWRKHWLDSRLVEAWTYDAQDSGSPRFACTVGLSGGVRVALPPPLEKRIAVDGRFLDEVQISQGGNTSLSFPVERHRGVIGEDGTATAYAMMPSAMQLFAEATCLASVAPRSRLPSADGSSARWCSPRSAAAARATGTTSRCSGSDARTRRPRSDRSR
jgi:hypothetical protein